MIIGFSLSLVWVVPYSGGRGQAVAVLKEQAVIGVEQVAVQKGGARDDTLESPVVQARLSEDEDLIDSLLSEEDEYLVSETVISADKMDGGLVHFVWERLCAKVALGGDPQKL